MDSWYPLRRRTLMSVTADYCLILGMDGAEGVLHESTKRLSELIDKVDWYEKPIKGTIDDQLTYFWWSVIGPYFKGPDSAPPLERLIEIVRKEYPDVEKHYSLIVWCEQQLHRIDGSFADHIGPDVHKTVVIHTEEGPVDLREHFRKWNDLDVMFRKEIDL